MRYPRLQLKVQLQVLFQPLLASYGLSKLVWLIQLQNVTVEKAAEGHFRMEL